MREATKIHNNVLILLKISIHASLAGSDTCVILAHNHPSDFNPRFPCGKRQTNGETGYIPVKFQSTLPLREATLSALFLVTRSLISIHASLAGSDTTGTVTCAPRCSFQSTLPLREATKITVHGIRYPSISIHASLAGSDLGAIKLISNYINFNPRFPCGKRPKRFII